MKRVIIDLEDDYSDVLAVTAIGMVPNGGGHVLNVHGGIALDLHEKNKAHYAQVFGSDGKLMIAEVYDE